MVGEGRASKLKNRYFLVGCGHFCSIFMSLHSSTPALALSEELKSVEKPSSKKRVQPGEPFSPARGKIWKRAENLVSRFLTWPAKMAPSVEPFFLDKGISTDFSSPDNAKAGVKGCGLIKIEEKCPQPTKKYLFFNFEALPSPTMWARPPATPNFFSTHMDLSNHHSLWSKAFGEGPDFAVS